MNIILVDDEELILEELDYLCSDIEDITVCGRFWNPLEAREYVRCNPVDFAFLDIQMPGITGLELLQELRDCRPHLQAAFVTAYDQYALEAYRSDACDYLLKPFGKTEVEHALDKGRRLLRFEREEKPEIRTFGRFELLCGGQAVDFPSRKAKELLALLVGQRGGMIDIDYAVTMLWEDEPYGKLGRARFRKALMNLRSTLKEHGLSELIQTRRGRICLDCSMVDCDYFRLMDGDPKAAEKFHGEFMSQYSWGEFLIPGLEKQASM